MDVDGSDTWHDIGRRRRAGDGKPPDNTLRWRTDRLDQKACGPWNVPFLLIDNVSQPNLIAVLQNRPRKINSETGRVPGSLIDLFCIWLNFVAKDLVLSSVQILTPPGFRKTAGQPLASKPVGSDLSIQQT